MKIINTTVYRKYGSDRTSLCLTEKAQRLYDTTDPIEIWEKYDDAAGTNLYTIKGIFNNFDEWVTETELNLILEDLSDELDRQNEQEAAETLYDELGLDVADIEDDVLAGVLGLRKGNDGMDYILYTGEKGAACVDLVDHSVIGDADDIKRLFE